MNKSGSVFTKGTQRNICPPGANKHAITKQDQSMTKSGVSGQPFQPGNKKVLNREIACSDQPKAQKKDITKPINSTTWTPGTRKEENRQIKSSKHQMNKKLLMESQTVSEEPAGPIHTGRRQ